MPKTAFLEDMLSRPINGLNVNLKGPTIAPYLSQLNQELKAKNIPFTPKVWISDDWFSPDGFPGFAVPFYLLNPQLLEMEKKYTGEVEGVNPKELMKLLRHETAHALDNAFGLRRNKLRQKLFGLSGTPYPKDYTPNKATLDYVENLPDNYAQSHPEEDFAETFAVWLDPKSNWKKKYKYSVKALEKLYFVDNLISGIERKKIKKSSIPPSYELKGLKGSLENYYLKKRKRLGIVELIDVKKDLHKIFSNKVESKKVINAAKLIKLKHTKISDLILADKKSNSGSMIIKKRKIKKLLIDVQNYCHDQELTTSNSNKSINNLSYLLLKRAKTICDDKNRIIM
jgi:hypothetical protein